MTTNKLKPDWAGDDLISRIVNALINIPPLFNLMKHQARQVIIKTAEKNGIPWRKSCQELEQSKAQEYYHELLNDQVTYPDYYQVPFHAYDEGNLCWKAACEAPSATYAMALRVWPKETLTWKVAQDRLRHAFLDVVQKYSPHPIRDMLDIGCSVGISTLELHRYFSQKQSAPIRTVGLDLSPYMLAVAKTLDEGGEIAQWIHGLAEKTDFPDNSFDVITLQFVLHELPQQPTINIFKEVLRILRPGGCLAIVDNNPKSTIIQNLPPALFVLMKSTEPWSDDFYTFNVEESLQELGFDYQTTIPTDPRHRTIIALKKLTVDS